MIVGIKNEKKDLCKIRLSKLLLVLFNIVIVCVFSFITLGMIEMIVSEVKYFTELRDEWAILEIVCCTMYIVSMWATYLYYYLNNEITKKIIFSTTLSVALYIFISNGFFNALSWILFLYCPIIIVYLAALIKNKQKSET